MYMSLRYKYVNIKSESTSTFYIKGKTAVKRKEKPNIMYKKEKATGYETKRTLLILSI